MSKLRGTRQPVVGDVRRHAGYDDPGFAERVAEACAVVADLAFEMAERRPAEPVAASPVRASPTFPTQRDVALATPESAAPSPRFASKDHPLKSLFDAKAAHDVRRNLLNAALAQWTAGNLEFQSIEPVIERFEASHATLIREIRSHAHYVEHRAKAAPRG